MLSDNTQNTVSENQNYFLSPGHFPALHLHQHFCNQNQIFPLVYDAQSRTRWAERGQQKPIFVNKGSNSELQDFTGTDTALPVSNYPAASKNIYSPLYRAGGLKWKKKALERSLQWELGRGKKAKSGDGKFRKFQHSSGGHRGSWKGSRKQRDSGRRELFLFDSSMPRNRPFFFGCNTHVFKGS